MVEKSRSQELFDAVYSMSLRLGYDTYDYVPGGKVPYPFVFVGEQFEQEQRTKSGTYAIVQQTIHVYHYYEQRRDLTNMVDGLKKELRQLRRSGPFYFAFKNATGRTITDNSTSDTLLHAVLEIEFRIN